jgi:3-oxoacyl-[acyl-carrier protein] reductase
VSDGDGLAGQVALVTGAGRNLGRAIALELASRGADVAVNVRENVAEGETVAAAIRRLGRRAVVVGCDVGDRDAVLAMAGRAADELGPITTLVCNAGVRRQGHALAATAEEWDESLSVNLSGVFHCVRAVVDGMRERRFGRIVAISGVVAHYPARAASGNFAHVAAAKLGMEGLLRALATDLAPDGITCNTIVCGALATSRPAPVASPMPMVGRLGSPDEIAYLCGVLCSPRAGFVTGQSIFADGGGPASISH